MTSNIQKDTADSDGKVSLFFVGVGKCGTSWLFEFLRRRKLMSLPRIKEPYFLNCKPEKWDREVASLYQETKNMADFSTVYYWDPQNADTIKQYNPNAKIIITIRRPSARIRSHFKFLQRNGCYSSMTLPAFLQDGDCEDIVKRSDYHEMIKRYERVFGSENVLLLPMEQLKDDPQLYIDRLLRFCELESVTLTEEDKKPVLKSSSARNVAVARVAKFTASTMRSLRLLRILGMLKDSKLLRGFLFREEKKAAVQRPPEGFGTLTETIEQMDLDYEPLLQSCYDT